MHARQIERSPHNPGVGFDRPTAGVEGRAWLVTIQDFIPHLIGVGQDVADQDTRRAQSRCQPGQIRQFGDVALQGNELDPQRRYQGAQFSFHFVQATDVIQHLGDHGATHTCIRLRRDPVEGDDQAIHPQCHQFAGHCLVQEEPVGADGDRQAPLAGQTHHLQDVGMRQRFAQAAEDHPPQLWKCLRLLQQLAENLHLHVGFGVFPNVANAGAALEIADGGRLYVELAQVRQSWEQNKGGIALVEPPFHVF